MSSGCGDAALIANVEAKVDHPESFNRVDTTPFAVMASHGVSIVHEIAWSRARSCWAPREASRELENQIATASAAAARRKDVCLRWGRPYKAELGAQIGFEME